MTTFSYLRQKSLIVVIGLLILAVETVVREYGWKTVRDIPLSWSIILAVIALVFASFLFGFLVVRIVEKKYERDLRWALTESGLDEIHGLSGSFDS